MNNNYLFQGGCVKIELHPKSFLSNFWGAVQNRRSLITALALNPVYKPEETGAAELR